MQLSMTHPVASAPTSGHPDEGKREPCQSRVHTLSINLEGPSTGDVRITAVTRSVESERQNPQIGGSCALEVPKQPSHCGEREAEPPNWGLTHSQSTQMASPSQERKAKPPNWRFRRFQNAQTASWRGEREAEPPSRGLTHSRIAQTASPS
jgi:hypothetical protein